MSLTVTDLARSRRWYADVLGWQEATSGRSETTSFAHGTLADGTTIVLRVHDEPEPGAFSERKAGLDHLSLAASSRDDLQGLADRLQMANGAAPAIQELPYGNILCFRDPDNIALEAFAPA